MNKYYFSQLISEIYPKLQGLRARLYAMHTPSEHNAVDLVNFDTEGGATFADFIVPPPQRSLSYNFVVAPRNLAKSRNLQLRKNSI